MNLLPMAEQLSAAMNQPAITLDWKRCLRALNKNADCEACVQACPTGAIHLNKPVAFDSDICVGCGACLHRCPVGAFTGDDHFDDVLNCTLRLVDTEHIELVCTQHPAPDLGPRGVDGVLRTGACLAALGPSAYVSLLALGIETLSIRLDACAACPIGKLKAEIVQSAATAQRLVEAANLSKRIEIVDAEHRTGWKKSRPIYAARNPPLSRRSFFRVFGARNSDFTSQILAQDSRPGSAKTPPRERRRLLRALAFLPMQKPISSEGLPFARFTAGDTCTACGVCSRLCPTGALNLSLTENDEYRLTFSAGACVDCGLCLAFCQPAALQRDQMSVELLATEPTLVRQGSLRRCAKCGTKFAGSPETTLCPSCEFRRQNPLQSRVLAGEKPHQHSAKPNSVVEQASD